jgi:hypothetical protein
VDPKAIDISKEIEKDVRMLLVLILRAIYMLYLTVWVEGAEIQKQRRWLGLEGQWAHWGERLT